MKKITSFLVSIIMLVFLCFLLTSCGDKNENKLPNSDYEKVKFAFKGVENSIKSSKTSNSDGTKKKSLNLNNVDDALSVINNVYESGDSQGDIIDELEYDQPPMIQFQCIQKVLEKIGSNYKFGTKYYDNITGNVYVNLETGEKVDSSSSGKDNYKYNYNFLLSLEISIDENNLIKSELTFNINLNKDNKYHDIEWYVNIELDYDMENTSPNYKMTMLTANDQHQLSYQIGYVYEYDYVNVVDNKINEWRKFGIEANQRLSKEVNESFEDYVQDSNFNYDIACHKWYKNNNLRKVTQMDDNKRLTLAKAYYSNLGLNSSEIDSTSFINKDGDKNSKIASAYKDFSSLFKQDLIYCLIVGSENEKEEEEEGEEKLDYSMIKFFVVDSNGNPILENNYPNNFDNSRLSSIDVTILDTFKNDNIWAGDSPTYYDIFLIDKDGKTYVKADKTILNYKLIYNDKTINITLNDKLKDIFETNNITKDENNLIQFTISVSYPKHDNIVGSAKYEVDLSDGGNSGTPEEKVISGIQIKNKDNNGYGTTTPYEDSTLDNWFKNDIINYVEGSDGKETFDDHPYVAYVDQNAGFMSFVDLSKTEYSVQFNIDDMFVTKDKSLKFSDIIAEYGFDTYEVRVKIGDYYSEPITIRLYDYNTEISSNYFSTWRTDLFIEYGFDEDLIPPAIAITHNVSEYDDPNPYKKYLFERTSDFVSVIISSENDVNTYISTLEGLGYVKYTKTIDDKEFSNRKGQIYIKTLDDGTRYVFELEAPSNNRYVLNYQII